MINAVSRDDTFPEDFLLGVNYWPAEHGVHWWAEFSPAVVERDLALIQAMGLNCLRLFLRWQDFQPAPERVSEEALAAFDQVVALARRRGLRLIPTLFTGHMSGENWDVSWRQGRCPYTDPALLRAQLALVRCLGRRYGEEEAIAAWDLANEHDNYAPLPDADAAWLWTHLLTREFRLFARQAVLLGTHVTSFTERRTFRFPDLGQLHAVLCVHPYPIYSELCPGRPDLPPSTLFPSFCLKLARGLGGKPVLLEEFGLTTTMVGEEEAAAYYRTVLFSTLAAGARGALAWCFADFSNTGRPPYATVPYEIGFGLTWAGRPKAPGKAMAAFAALLGAFPWGELEPAPAPAAVLLPARYYDHPEREFSPARHFALLFASYVLAKQAGLEVDFVLPGAPLEGYRLVLCPVVPRRGTLDLPHWEQLVAFVRQGGCLYLSFGGLAFPDLEEILGARRLYADSPTRPALWERCRPGHRLVLEPRTAKVLRRGGDGLPLFLTHRYGEGTVLFATEPLESYLADAPHLLAVNPFYPFYRYAARAAGLMPEAWGGGLPAAGEALLRGSAPRGAPPACAAPKRTASRPGGPPRPVPGEAKLFLPREAGATATAYLVLVNHHGRETAWPNPGGFPWEDLATGQTFSGPVPLAAHQGRLLRLSRPGA